MHRFPPLLLRPACLIALLLMVGLTPAGALRAAALDPAGQSAAYLLQDATRIQRDGTHNRLLGALRHLRDPALRPFFERLVSSSHPTLQVHGVLGLAELSPEGKLDLGRLAEVTEPVVQAELLTASLDADLLAVADARQLLTWKGLDLSVKLLVASYLMERDMLGDAALLHEALASDTAGRHGLAALLLHQLGDPAGTAALNELDASKDRQRDVIRAMLLRTAARHGLTRAGNWAYAIATEPNVDPALGHLALRTAMRLGDARASALWRQRYESSTDAADRTRLALLALRLAPWLEPALFDAMATSDDPLIAAMGRAGGAIAADDPRRAEHVVPLLLLHHPLVNEWALEYARDTATPQDAQIILLGMIRAYEQGPQKTRVQRLDHVIAPTLVLFEEHPQVAAQLLTPLLRSEQTGVLLKQGLLLGLVRSRADATAVVQALPDFTDSDTQSLALLLKARTALPLSPTEMKDLELLVRGGGKLQDTLRMQAGWVYLTRTRQAAAALAAVELP